MSYSKTKLLIPPDRSESKTDSSSSTKSEYQSPKGTRPMIMSTANKNKNKTTLTTNINTKSNRNNNNNHKISSNQYRSFGGVEDELQSVEIGKEKVGNNNDSTRDIRGESTCKADQTCLSLIFSSIWTMIKFVISYSLIYSIISEVLLLINIYSSDPLFFGLSISFLIIPLLFVSCMTCYWYHDDKNEFDEFPASQLLYCPIINIAIFWSGLVVKENEVSGLKWLGSMWSSVLAGLMTFPLYIINLSYLLENAQSFNDISIFNYIQLLFSLINLTITPIQTFVTGIVEPSKDDEHVGCLNKCKIYLLWTFYFYPIALIEIVHFFPYLFLYYIDKQIVLSQLVVILSIFNIPKLLFVIHGEKKAFKSSEGDEFPTITRMLTLLFLSTVPLIPYVIIMIYKDKAQDISCICQDGWYSSVSIYYWNIVIYLLISYGGSTIYTIILVGGLNQLSLQVQIAFIVFLTLIILIIITLPVAFYCIKKPRH